MRHEREVRWRFRNTGDRPIEVEAPDGSKRVLAVGERTEITVGPKERWTLRADWRPDDGEEPRELGWWGRRLTSEVGRLAEDGSWRWQP